MKNLGDEQDWVVLRDARSGKWLLFRRPCQVVCAHSAGEVLEKLQLLEDKVQDQNLHAAGFLAYEAAPAFDPAFRVRADDASSDATDNFPLLWFGLYEQVEILDQPQSKAAVVPSLNWTASISEERYHRDLGVIREHLRLGNSYQVNFTFRLHASFQADPWEFFQAVASVNPPPHAAYVGLKDWAICSFSPELFFFLDGQSIFSKPMKGTRARGMTLEEDRRFAEDLRMSAKDRAENVMIVDMVRNDLGRIAEPGSVRLTDLFAVEKHATVWQMTSCVAAQTGRPLLEILSALFPPASITGAPKAAATGIIADLETRPRRIYTGCIGYLGPGRKAEFNVAIRTVLVDKRKGIAEYGVGGGIVWDSNALGEYDECRTKARVLECRVPDFQLLETMLWSPGRGYCLLERHLARLCASAEYFDFPVDVETVREALRHLAAQFGGQERMVRLLVHRDGGIAMQDLPVPNQQSGLRVGVGLAPVCSADPYLYHKTTFRAVYEQALASRPGFDDVILYNERGEATESTRANVLAQLDGILYTPPVSCGLLAGTLRGQMLEQGEVLERILKVSDLMRAESIYLINSVRGKCKVEVVFE